YVFVRGSAGAGIGIQGSIQRTWTFNDGISGSEFTIAGSTSWGIVGASIEVGGGGSMSANFKIPTAI
ncbi:MAG: hypothetical protein ACRC37_02565, partial [Lentisphaeria bacterium]